METFLPRLLWISLSLSLTFPTPRNDHTLLLKLLPLPLLSRISLSKLYIYTLTAQKYTSAERGKNYKKQASKRMAIGRPSRSGKRTSSSSSSSSSSSYTSTITTIAFIALCVLGVWMLTSTSVNNPPSSTNLTNKAAVDSTSTSTADASSASDLADNTRPVENNNSKKQSVFEDNPGDLPADAIKSDQGDGKAEAAAAVAEDKDKHTQISEESTMTTAQSVNQQVISEETMPVDTKEAEDEKPNSEPEKPTNSEPEKPNSEPQKPQPEEKAEINPDDTQNILTESKPTETEEVKSLDELQRQHLKTEDARIQDPVEEKPENKVTEEDQAQRMHQQQQQMHDAQKVETATHDQPEKGTEINDKEDKQIFRDVTTPGVQVHQLENQDPQHPVQQKPNDAGGSSSEIPKESKESKKSWSTQASESENEKERRKVDETKAQGVGVSGETNNWQLCNVTAGSDYIPCLDNEKAIKQLRYTGHFEHRERHCPEEPPTCLVPAPEGYKTPIPWPSSRDKIWYHNVPHTKLAEFKGHQNWVKVTGEFLTFPGGGTQFIHGALHYIDFLQKAVPKIGWGKHTRVILDVGCGVASFGGYIFERDVLTMSFAPKDEHEAQVQFALERGIPAISAVMGSKRLPFPSSVFDAIHCARCRVPWHNEGHCH
ncbi:Probable methyltransferase PMT27 [Linum grandiflorum]